MKAQNEILEEMQKVLYDTDIMLEPESKKIGAIMAGLLTLAKHIDLLAEDVYKLQKHEDIEKK